jgi:hypothetical protein
MKWLVIPIHGQVSNPLKLVPHVNGETGLWKYNVYLTRHASGRKNYKQAKYPHSSIYLLLVPIPEVLNKPQKVHMLLGKVFNTHTIYASLQIQVREILVQLLRIRTQESLHVFCQILMNAQTSVGVLKNTTEFLFITLSLRYIFIPKLSCKVSIIVRF